MTQTSPTLTGQELAIMKVVWAKKDATVREVYETLRERRRIAYTTVMTMMNILEQKGFLRKSAGDDRAFVYEPARSRKTVMRAMVNDFVDRVFGGSANPLMVHLLEEEHLTPKDLDDLRKSIKRKPSSS